MASLVFKTMDALLRRVVGSIPIHLRQMAALDILAGLFTVWTGRTGEQI